MKYFSIYNVSSRKKKKKKKKKPTNVYFTKKDFRCKTGAMKQWTGVAAVAAKGILSIFGGDPGQWIQDSINGGRNFIDASLNAGQNFLNKLMGK